MALRSRFIVGVACFAVWMVVPFLPAQQNRGARQVHEMLLLDVDNAATKKFATVQTHLRVGQLREAIELLQSIGDAHQGKLVAAAPGRYVNVQNYAQMLAAGLPPEGLQIYREELDPILKPTFEAARQVADEAALQKLLLNGYCCSFADDALLMLGDLAWDAGEVWRARSYWEQLLPAPPPTKPGDPVLWLAYPDSDLDRPSIVGRLILCSIQAGLRSDIQKELAEFARQFPNAEGHLAGKTGNLLEILQGLARDSESWREPVQTSVVETFAGSGQRFQVASQPIELGNLRWRAALKVFGEEPRRGFQRGSQGGLCYFPVVYGDVVLVNDDEHIYAYSLRTGNPAWSDAPGDSPIYSSGIDNRNVGNQPRGFNEALLGNIGLPRFTMTIADGRLYARMGSVQPYTGDRGGLLVCVDLAQSEGKLVWETFASSVEPDADGWIFEGSPLVMGGRVYVGLRRLNPQPQANVACFDALTGKLIWNRKLCVGQTNPNFTDFDVNQHLLTWGDGTLYYATHMGAVAALDPRQGSIKWIVSYPRVEDTKLRHELASRLRRGPLPALFANGVLYVAPLDSDELLALDSETGMLKWKRSFGRPIQSLLGVAKGRLYVSGAELYAVSTDSGQIAWKVGDPDPESHGFGRGLLVGDLVYWPTHEEIFLIEQETGVLRQRLPLFAVHGQYGGNLVLVDQYLLVTQPDGLAVFSDRGPPVDRSKSLKPEFTRKVSPARYPWDLARQAMEQQQWGPAADHFRRTRELAQSDDEWMGRPLSEVAFEREIDARLRHAWALTKSDPSAANRALLRVLETVTRRSVGTTRPTASTLEPLPEDPLEQPGHWMLRIPSSIPDDMRAWISDQILVHAASPGATGEDGASSGVERVTTVEGAEARLVSWRHSLVAEDDVVSRQLTEAERLVSGNPQQAAAALRRVTSLTPTPAERGRAWCGVARALEAQRAWAAAIAAWRQAEQVGRPDMLVTIDERQLPISDLIRDRLERPEYVKQHVLMESREFPSLLRRHWRQTFGRQAHVVYPVGSPPALDLACVLVDQPPVTCLNLADGRVRWQSTLSHPLLWSGFVSEHLLLATAVEVRAVSVHSGEVIWRQGLTRSDAAATQPLRDLLVVEYVAATGQPDGTIGSGSGDDLGSMSEFALAGDTLLARQHNGRVLAWNALEGRLIWQFEASRGLADGWAVTDKHVLVSQRSPASLVILNRTDGSVVARHFSDSAAWMRPPVIRDDGTILTVGRLGRIESWSKPGAAWEADEGPRAWAWNVPFSQSIVPPDVLFQGHTSLLLLDGQTLIAVDSIRGNTLWKTVLGVSPIDDARSAVCCDEDHVYVAAEGMLRAFDIRAGGLDWERYLGSPSLAWKSRVRGATVIAYPEKSAPPGMEGRIALCEAASGRYVQRLQLPEDCATVQIHPTAHTTLVACGGTLYGLGR